jgi:histidyl-tRNA synthetase
MTKVSAIRGFNDILPEDSALWRAIESRAHEIFSTYGFSEIRLPVLEKTELFTRSVGETTDIVEKEMYTFPDRGGEMMTLRPEGTASAVRAYVEHQLYTSPVTKLFYAGPMFRYERPQKGRYRQFYQIGAEILGDPSPNADAETMEMLVKLFGSLGLKDAVLNINSLGCSECRPGYRDALKNFLDAKKSTLCENCVRRVNENPLRALDCKSKGCIEATTDAPMVTGHVCQKCSEHFEGVKRHLSLLRVAFVVNPRMVRGLDYYTRTTFEVTSSGLGAQNAVAAGGRYDNLVSELGGPPTPCFGFAFGMERLAMLVSDSKPKARPLICVIALGDGAVPAGIETASALRASGERVLTDMPVDKLKNALKRADRAGARYAVILGDDEIREGAAAIKDLSTGAQEKVSLQSAVVWFNQKCSGN